MRFFLNFFSYYFECIFELMCVSLLTRSKTVLLCSVARENLKEKNEFVGTCKLRGNEDWIEHDPDIIPKLVRLNMFPIRSQYG